ncbi:MAG TPA: hypothetical protein VJ860_15735 [Polyangia bacterium]|jgi:hypothetical protein|nr:hypothetical protein [Polyangia bacterium]
MTRFRNPRRRWPQAIAWLLLGLGLPRPSQPPRQAMAQGSKPVLHVFLQLDGKSSIVVRSFQSLDVPSTRLLGVET